MIFLGADFKNFQDLLARDMCLLLWMYFTLFSILPQILRVWPDKEELIAYAKEVRFSLRYPG